MERAEARESTIMIERANRPESTKIIERFIDFFSGACQHSLPTVYGEQTTRST